MSLIRSTGTEDPLKFQAGHDIGMLTVGERIAESGIIGNESGRQDDRSHPDLVNLCLLLEVDRACGTELLTRLAPPLFLEINAMLFINHILEWNGLRIMQVCGLSFGQAGIVDIGNPLRAFFCTCTAGNAQIRINVAGRLENCYLKVACLTGDALHFRQRKQLDVGVPADPDQFRRENSHGALVGRESLVKLRHGPTDGGRCFDQVDAKPG